MRKSKATKLLACGLAILLASLAIGMSACSPEDPCANGHNWDGNHHFCTVCNTENPDWVAPPQYNLIDWSTAYGYRSSVDYVNATESKEFISARNAQKYEAESATLVNATVTESSQASGGKSVGGMNATSTITFDIVGYETCTVLAVMSVSTTSSNNWEMHAATDLLSLTYDTDKTADISDCGIEDTGAYDSYSEVELGEIQLTAGENTITMKALAEGFNVDYLMLIPKTDEIVLPEFGINEKIEAENCSVSGCKIEKEGLASNKKQISWTSNNTALRFTIKTDAACSEDLVLCISCLITEEAGGNLVNDRMGVLVNGTALSFDNLVIPESMSDADWWKLRYELNLGKIALSAGLNEIEITISNNLNMDFLYFGSIPSFSYEKTGVEIENREGKAFFVVNGTYTSEGFSTPEIKTILADLPIGFMRNPDANGVPIDDLLGEYYQWNFNGDDLDITVSDGTFKVGVDISELEEYTFVCKYSESDLKLDVEFRTSVSVGGNDYSLVSIPGADSGADFWGCVGLIVGNAATLSYEKTNVAIENRNGSAYCVLSGTYESTGYIQAELQDIFAKKVVGFFRNPNAAGYEIEDDLGAWGTVEYTDTDVTLGDGTFSVAVDISKITKYVYSCKFGGDDIKITSTFDSDIVIGDRVYGLFSYPGIDDGRTCWGNVGLAISDASDQSFRYAPQTAAVEDRNGSAYFVISAKYISRNYTEAEIAAKFADLVPCLMGDPLIPDIPENADLAWKTMQFADIDVTVSNGTIKVAFDISECQNYAYALKMKVPAEETEQDCKWKSTFDSSVTIGGKTYKVSCTPIDEETVFWGMVGLIITDAAV